MIANMVMPHQYLIKTKSFILNLIKEGDVVEANRLLELDLQQLVQRSNTQSELSELERLPGGNTKGIDSWRHFTVSYVLYFLLIITICYHNRIIPFLPCSFFAFEIERHQGTNQILSYIIIQSLIQYAIFYLNCYLSSSIIILIELHDVLLSFSHQHLHVLPSSSST